MRPVLSAFAIAWLAAACRPPVSQHDPPEVDAKASLEPPFTAAPASSSLAASAIGACAVGSDRRVACWNTHFRPWRLGALPGDRAPTQLAADRGQTRVCGVADGQVFCWAIEPRVSATPIRIRGLGDAVAVAVSRSHGCVALRNGRVRCWGANAEAQLGDGTRDDRSVPVDVGLERATRVWVSDGLSCALADADVFCWGANPVAGDPRRLRPSRVGVAGASAFASGTRPCVVLTDGGVSCWEPVDHMVRDFTTPALEQGPTAVVMASVGDDHLCAVREQGRVSCLGANRHGQLGRGPAAREAFGPRVQGLENVVELVSAGDLSCAREQTGNVWCWGRLGYRDPRSPREIPTPTLVAGLDSVRYVAPGSRHTCAIERNGSLSCWGDRLTLAPAKQSAGWVGRPVAFPRLWATTAIAAGGAHTCVLRRKRGGNVYCWGGFGADALGQAAPLRQPIDGAAAIRTLALGSTAGCGLDRRGTLACWGAAAWRELGAGCEAPPAFPAWRIDVGHAVTFDLSDHHGCAVMRGGGVRCWGTDARGELGQPASARPSGPPRACGAGPPVRDVSVPPARQVATGFAHTCALARDGAVLCWGDNRHGQLGRGSASEREEPGPVAELRDVTRLEAGAFHTCALTRDRRVHCWGANDQGQLGDGRSAPVRAGGERDRSANRHRPNQLEGLADVVTIALGYDHSCAITKAGRLYCWGANEHGQVGRGGQFVGDQAFPVKIEGLP